MPTLSLFPSARFSPARPVVVAGALLISSGLLAQPAGAQTRAASSAPAPFALTAPPARSQRVSVLIIALDDPLAMPMGVVPDGPPLTGTAPTGSPFASEQPSNDLPLTALPPSPASWNGVPFAWKWNALAKKKPSKPDPRFLLLPDPPTNTTPGGGVGNGATATGASSGAPVPIAPVPGAPAPVMAPPRPVAPAGRTMLAALSLRRALAGLGYANVESASPDSNLVARALGDKRLAVGTLGTLRGALQALAAAPALPETERAGAIAKATQTANDAASSLGQATGYRAVVAFYVGPLVEGKAPFAIVLDDSTRESGEPILWAESAKNEASARETGAATGAALLDKSLRVWAAIPPVSTKTLAEAHLARARAAGVAGNLVLAQDEVLRVSVLDPSRTEGYTFLGDLLSPTDPASALTAYRRATQLDRKDGEGFAKMALALSNSPKSDFPGVLAAAKQAILNGTDTADLRIAMARAQFGRAGLFRAAEHIGDAEDAESNAQTNLDRALQLSPNNPEALKLMARALITSGRTIEGVQTLDRVAPLFPKDIDLQFQYASALLSLPNRKEDAFVAYSRVWKARGQSAANLDNATAQLLSQGFDQHVFALGKSGRQLSDGVAGGSIAREGAFLQLKRLKDDMNDASDAIALLRPPSSSPGAAAIARTFAASLMNQSLEEQQIFLDTGQDLHRMRAGDLFRQAVAQLNSARTGR